MSVSADSGSPKWPAAKVRMLPLGKLVASARNARTHSPEQVAQIAASMREWGWTNPVLADEAGEIIAGHGRILAAKSLGLEVAPVMTALGWSEEQKRAYVLADNKLALNADWDAEMVGVELLELEAAGFSLDLIGFNEAEIAQFTAVGQDPSGAWGGMPEFTQKSAQAFRSLVVHFRDQEAVDWFAAKIGREIVNRYIWIPEIERVSDVRRVYATEQIATETAP